MKYQSLILEELKVNSTGAAAAAVAASFIPFSFPLTMIIGRIAASQEIKGKGKDAALAHSLTPEQGIHLFKMMYSMRTVDYNENDLLILTDIKRKLKQNNSMDVFIDYIDTDLKNITKKERSNLLVRWLTKVVTRIHMGTQELLGRERNLKFIREFMLK